MLSQDRIYLTLFGYDIELNDPGRKQVFIIENTLLRFLPSRFYRMLHSHDTKMRLLSRTDPRSLHSQGAGADMACEMSAVQRMPCAAERQVFCAKRPTVLQRRLFQVSNRSRPSTGCMAMLIYFVYFFLISFPFVQTLRYEM